MTVDTSPITVATPAETTQSTGWPGPAAAVAVVVSTHSRAALLSGLLDALEAQDGVDFEVVVADNGSSDDTWSVLTDRCRRSPLRLLALRLPFHDGPAVPRNTAVAQSRSPLIAFTDDDCLPTPGWLSGLVDAFDDSTDIVQGRTQPEPGGWAGPWGRSLDVPNPSGLYETANLAVRREAFVRAGGFGGKRLLSGRAFGEDVVLGAAVAAAGGFRFATAADMYHRVMPGTYRDFVSERRRLAGFPQLLRLVPQLRSRAYLGVFLGKRRAITDLGLLAFAVAAVLVGFGQLIGLVALLAMLPWGLRLWREGFDRPGAPRAVRAMQLLVADVVGFLALVNGSLRARRLLL
jgi:glycosyltransferase involved in cell wall biosynthesis